MRLQDPVSRKFKRTRDARRMQACRLGERGGVTDVAPAVDHVKGAGLQLRVALLENDRSVERPRRIDRVAFRDPRDAVLSRTQRRDPLCPPPPPPPPPPPAPSPPTRRTCCASRMSFDERRSPLRCERKRCRTRTLR